MSKTFFLSVMTLMKGMKNVRNYPNDRSVEGVLTIIFGRINAVCW